MRRSKVSTERYDLSSIDLTKILALDTSQKIIDISVGGSKTANSPWSITFTVETTDSISIEVPSFIEK